MTPISTKWRLFSVFAAALTFALPSRTVAATLFNPQYDAPLLAAMQQTFGMQYGKADSIVARLPRDIPEQPYFSGLACMTRFQDLGDTSALRRAENFWMRLINNDPPQTFHADSAQLQLYRGLASLQLSYLASLRGSNLRAASLALSGRSLFLASHDWAEAEAGLALFDYYREHALEKIRFIPFFHPDSDPPLQHLEAAAEKSRYLRDGLRVSVFWIHVDRNETDSALGISDDFLKRFPENRLMRQMRGSALYRGGRLAEARKVYEDLLPEYAALKNSLPNFPPLGYACCVGNLARIYAGLGMKAESASKLAEWRNLSRFGLEPWLPSSLKKELQQF